MYGPTETTVWSTRSSGSNGAASASPSAARSTTPDVYVLDDDLSAGARSAHRRRDLASAATGWRAATAGRAELTAERFVADPFVPGRSAMYRTGDLGRRLGRRRCSSAWGASTSRSRSAASASSSARSRRCSAVAGGPQRRSSTCSRRSGGDAAAGRLLGRRGRAAARHRRAQGPPRGRAAALHGAPAVRGPRGAAAHAGRQGRSQGAARPRHGLARRGPAGGAGEPARRRRRGHRRDLAGAAGRHGDRDRRRLLRARRAVAAGGPASSARSRPGWACRSAWRACSRALRCARWPTSFAAAGGNFESRRHGAAQGAGRAAHVLHLRRPPLPHGRAEPRARASRATASSCPPTSC